MLRIFKIIAFFSFALVLTPTQSAYASKCLAYVENTPDIVPVKLGLAESAKSVEIAYVTHSTFRLKTPAGVVIATDYAGYLDVAALPTVVTMNVAHETHYTDFPDPEIKHVLRGWNPEGGPVRHQLRVRDVVIRNVHTDIRVWDGGGMAYGNSIFIFEVADLCIGHLGHLHHNLTPSQLARIGRLDIVFAPVDGTYTLDLPTMIDVLKGLKASLVIPMHYFSGESLNHFLRGMRDAFVIKASGEANVSVSLATLPRRPTVMVLSGF
jgi:L-ascorbate metabolism protein UlaG (beta-lactamase superfamily)